MSHRKGDRAERELSNWLEDTAGWYAQRTGASGAATDRARPDVIACRGHPIDTRQVHGVVPEVAMIEAKAWRDATGQLDAAEVDELIEAADRAGGIPLVAVRPDLRRHEQWHVFDARELHSTPGGNYSVRKRDLPGKSREEVFG